MLPRRSIVVEACLILLLTHHSTCQYDYSAEDDGDAEYQSEYSDEGHGHPDYTKYFSAKAAASGQVASKANPSGFGFVNQADFESFFSTPIVSGFGEPANQETLAPQTFVAQPKKNDPFEALRQSFTQKEAASESNPLRKDYFEESQKKTEEGDVQPGPHYVSHQLPLPSVFGDEERASSKDDVETIPPPVKRKHSKKVKIDAAKPGYDGFKDSYDAFDLLRKTEEQIEQNKIDPAIYGGKNVDYNIGKSSSTVSQYPAATGYGGALKGIPTTTLSPYQKYSFQPVTTNYEALQSKYLEALVSTAAPLKFEKFGEKSSLNQDISDGLTQPSESVPANLKNKGCRRIVSPENAEGMNCFVCEDAANKAKYTQCSYTSQDEPVNAYAGTSLRYSTPVKAPESFRYKRSPGKYSDDPYFQVSSRSKKLFQEFDKEQEVAETERKKDFHYTPYNPEEYESESESQSSELLKDPGACQKVDREGMTCTVCRNAKTGGNFEQCSYTSAPKEEKYAYVAEKKYDSDDEPEETKTVLKSSNSEPQKSESVIQSTVAPASGYQGATKSKIVRDVFPELVVAGTTIDARSEDGAEAESDEESSEESDDESEESEESDDNKKKEKSGDDDGPNYFSYGDSGESKKDKKIVSDDPYDVPEHFAASVQDKKTEEADEDNFDEYHYKIFPEFHKESESKNEEQQSPPEGNQQDVEEVLAEFAKKDRSNCKKAEKNGMTCFLCVDKNKVQHEECMYIQESKPKPIHVAYHEVQRLKDPKKEADEKDESEDTEESRVKALTEQPLDIVLPLASETSKRKKFFKKVTTPLPLLNLGLAAAASEVHRTVVPFGKPKRGYVKNVVKDSRASASAPDSERLEEKKEDPETPAEIDVADEEGAYSHETKPVYSKLFGTTLPKYMVEKTEFEKDFDAASGFD